MLQMTPNGLYCEVGDFYIDPRRKVERAVITHAHSDHARPGMGSYLAHPHTAALMRKRLGARRHIEELDFGATTTLNGVQISLHPAGHVAGSSQVRLEYQGEVWVVTGDYKREPDPVSAPFEVVPCHTLITECTFGLPVYQWPETASTITAMRAWWQQNAESGEVSVIRAYSLGKAQRILTELAAMAARSGKPLPGPIYVSRAIAEMNDVLAGLGYTIPETIMLPGTAVTQHTLPPQALVMTSTALHLRNHAPLQVAEASGWLAVLRHHRPRTTSFVMSDHADWPSLLQTVHETGAERVLTVHGFTDPLARFLGEQGLNASALERGNGRTAPELPADPTYLDDAEERRSQKYNRMSRELGIPSWLFHVCVEHTGRVRETMSLLNTGTYTPRRMRVNTSTDTTPDIPLKDVTFDTVLYHVHRQTNSPAVQHFTMAIWHGDQLIPLAHVPSTVDRKILRAILDFAIEHTTIKVGPVRTIEPHFVFTIKASALSLAPRKKSGVALHDAEIVAFHEGRHPSTADRLEKILDIVKGALA